MLGSRRETNCPNIVQFVVKLRLVVNLVSGSLEGRFPKRFLRRFKLVQCAAREDMRRARLGKNNGKGADKRYHAYQNPAQTETQDKELVENRMVKHDVWLEKADCCSLLLVFFSLT